MNDRRAPGQARSRRTVERIVDAAAHDFAEREFAATTNHVAERAGVSIDSLDQYFPNKDAILVVLHERHIDSVEAHLVGCGPVGDAERWVQWLV